MKGMKMVTLCAAILLATASGVGRAEKPASQKLTVAQIAEKAIPSIVQIRAGDSLGTGFVAASGGRIATNLHVIRGVSEVTIITADGRETKEVEVMAVDPAHDLALLRIGRRDLTPLTLGVAAELKPGEHVVAIGNPLGLGNTISDGLVSAVRKLSDTSSILQISAPISPGSSGGPVFNDAGKVIGISTLIVQEGQNLNFAVPVDALKPLLDAKVGTPFADLANKAGRRGMTPTHDVAMLNDCPSASRLQIAIKIQDAIEIGAELYNDGNPEACYRIYAAAALEIDKELPQCVGPRKALLDGVQRADALSSYDDKAWALRYAFDGIMDVMVRALESKPEAPAAARKGTQFPASLLKDCRSQDVQQIGSTLEAALRSGGPLYKDGKLQASYRIYQGAVSDVERKVTGCPAGKRALQDGLRAAEGTPDWSTKALALQDTFMGLLEVIKK
jgi:S1-C subfamily serine protease